MLTSDDLDAMRRAVRKGADLLDSRGSMWREKVSIPDLNMSIPRDCIIGQAWEVTLFSEYVRAVEVLSGREFADGPDRHEWEAAHGFSLPPGLMMVSREHCDAGWAQLAEFWIEELEG